MTSCDTGGMSQHLLTNTNLAGVVSQRAAGPKLTGGQTCSRTLGCTSDDCPA